MRAGLVGGVVSGKERGLSWVSLLLGVLPPVLFRLVLPWPELPEFDIRVVLLGFDAVVLSVGVFVLVVVLVLVALFVCPLALFLFTVVQLLSLGEGSVWSAVRVPVAAVLFFGPASSSGRLVCVSMVWFVKVLC